MINSETLYWLIYAIMKKSIYYSVSSFQKIENPCFIYLFSYNLENLSCQIAKFKFIINKNFFVFKHINGYDLVYYFAKKNVEDNNTIEETFKFFISICEPLQY